MVHSSPTVNILEVVRVSPPPSDSITLPLTFFDLGWLKLHPVDRLLFYRVPDLSRSVLISKLKSSLSATLHHYLPLAGRLVWNPTDTKPSIVYSPDEKDAVYVTVAESNGDITRLTGNEPRTATEFHPLVPELPVSDESARALAVQITFFPNQGFSLGVTAHHAVLDGKTTAMFLKAWAHNCKQEQDPLPHDLTPSIDRTVVRDPTGLETKLLNRWMSASNNKPSLKLGDGTGGVEIGLCLTKDDVERFGSLFSRGLKPQ
ncbi:hypothetical protein BRARA_I00344 [Brassica rapa]|uniref:Uncharacterized protein n=1 Tax=Brassica campestris TaxID=3711 RepID=A0A397XVN2_BRACM|nr:hypothetical protein BRARA_I00344 [Brassica rapa]